MESRLSSIVTSNLHNLRPTRVAKSGQENVTLLWNGFQKNGLGWTGSKEAKKKHALQGTIIRLDWKSWCRTLETDQVRLGLQGGVGPGGKLLGSWPAHSHNLALCSFSICGNGWNKRSSFLVEAWQPTKFEPALRKIEPPMSKICPPGNLQ